MLVLGALLDDGECRDAAWRVLDGYADRYLRQPAGSEERKAEYDQSERRIGITKEYWFLASTPAGDQLVVGRHGPVRVPAATAPPGTALSMRSRIRSAAALASGPVSPVGPTHPGQPLSHAHSATPSTT